MAPKRKTLSQPNPTNSKTKIHEHRSTQPTIAESFREVASVDISDQANDCVRYMIYKAGQQLPFRKNDLQKHIKGPLGKGFDKILEKASSILENVYGFKVILCDGGSKFYILSNNLPHIEEESQEVEIPEDRRKVLLMLVLTHIYMSSNGVTEASLHSFLKCLHIDPERNHEIFGNVKEYLNVTLVKQHYLNVEKHNITQDLTFTWGARAEKEVSKHELLKFVCKVFKGSNPKSWSTQYKEAEEQPLENQQHVQIEIEEDNRENE